ncbi:MULTISPECIES: PP2C family protein-serine/threonine phosphatase [Mesorhizobium]|uniref:PP2C family protein-serine/threonine phosphatase n=1 Tax=Mesorhizobium TaxID=68287 RepID=UPI0013151729|nr:MULTISPECIES: protein phosphatase 2C domain-containing protein [Mesorhizobium]
MIKFDSAAVSDAGPREVNEDRVASWTTDGGALVVAIADGLGGMGGGADASTIAIERLQLTMNAAPATREQLILAANEAHQEILEAQKTSIRLRQMATTLTAGVFTEQGLLGVHCGDSRASIARANGIKRLTVDHSEGERLFRAGKLSRDELHDYPRKNILDSALGSHDKPQIDTFEFPLLPGDKIFFTTDGVHGKLLLREMRQMAAENRRAQEFVEQVAVAVRKRSPNDNFSIAAVFVY